jgi:putative phage-type endonuclease
VSVQLSREEWLAQRRTGIGGSDAAAVLGVSPWVTPLQLYMRKRGEIPEQESSEPMAWGLRLEEVIAKHWQSLDGRKIQRVNRILRHPKHAWCLANLDRVIWCDGHMPVVPRFLETRIREGLEVKTASQFARPDWFDGQDEVVPAHYTAQVQHYLAVTGAERWHMAVLIGGSEFITRVIERDEEIIAFLIEREEVFWVEHVVVGVPPEPTSLSDLKLLYRHDNGTDLEADESLASACRALAEVRAEIDAAEVREGELLLAIQRGMGEASRLVEQGAVLAVWRANKHGTVTDWKAVIAELGAAVPAELIAKHTAPKEVVRPFKLKV